MKERPGHSILMFGKGVNNDVPVDSPEIGFIFRGATLTSPNPTSGEAFRISFSLRKDTMKGTIKCRDGEGSRSGSALGDDGRGIARVRPGLIVIQNTVVFRDDGSMFGTNTDGAGFLAHLRPRRQAGSTPRSRSAASRSSSTSPRPSTNRGRGRTNRRDAAHPPRPGHGYKSGGGTWTWNTPFTEISRG